MGCKPASLPEEPAPESPTVEERTDFAQHFEEHGVTGTFALYDPSTNRMFVHDAVRAEQRFIPASTYKIPNSLIALETGVVEDTTTVLPWDGQARSFDAWNRDHTLATAFEFSTVWFYQEVARRIGAARMQQALEEADYGNANIGGGIDLFWLTGDLRISAFEQIAFLQQLHEEQLPFAERTQHLVKGIMVEERGTGYVLRGKTGWATGSHNVGWYVGYVVKNDQPHYFALNIDMTEMAQAPARREIAKAILRNLGLL
ncbi:MAG: OXA-48 family carbapenem-hydrolyzing class D beta-lactamase OXA-54 [Rhodothermales bacterium]